MPVLKKGTRMRMRFKKELEDDPNDDYCGVCLDSGDAILVGCDFCPLSFHFNCHLPALTAVPKSDWQCTFCKSKEDIPQLSTVKSITDARELALLNSEVPSSLPYGQFFNACKFLCELYKVKKLASLVLNLSFLRKSPDERPLLDLHSLREKLTLGKPHAYENTKEIIPALENMIEETKQFYECTPQFGYVLRVATKFKEIMTEYFPPDETEDRYEEEATIGESQNSEYSDLP